jgi:hypothetical protein
MQTNNTRKTQIIQVVLVLIVMLLPALSHAQMFPPGFGGDDNVDDVPVDGGLSLLIAAGAGYGARKLRKQKKSESQP